MLLAITMPSAKLSLHLMPVVFVMTTARRTRSQCVHPTRQHLRTSAFVCWTFVGARVTTLSIIPAVVQVRFKAFSNHLNQRMQSSSVMRYVAADDF